MPGFLPAHARPAVVCGSVSGTARRPTALGRPLAPRDVFVSAACDALFVTPSLTRISHVRPADPISARLRTDCDVLTTRLQSGRRVPERLSF
ncbi:hypothetical protein WM40_08480 [Robbsia andropogonis]|uniref:Uncharacterized protein n=1 Tax=Robbsia andropogonis TaxID=28092 RepID=A0A0F5K2H6_9BURK|nr:hypothetical protein WM40_08480 [Robbsia andropogonis]